MAKERFYVGLSNDRGFILTQLLDARIKGGWASAEARTARKKISDAISKGKYSVMLTGDEMESLVDAQSQIYKEDYPGYGCTGVRIDTYHPALKSDTGTTPYPRDMILGRESDL
jgi:phage tail tape-measure protein